MSLNPPPEMTGARSAGSNLQLSSLQWLLDHHEAKAGLRRQMVADLVFVSGNAL
jgi:hypothetical protein